MTEFVSPVKKHCAQCITLILSVCSVCSTPSYTQELPNKPKEFFGKNYASGSQPEHIPEHQQSPQKERQSETSSRQQAPDNQEGKKQKSVLIVSVVVNSLNKQHLTRVLETAFALHDQKIAYISTIQHFGDYRNVSSDVQIECKKRGIVIDELQELPQGLERESSPVWSILSREGRHIVTGVVALDRLINEWGEYDPKRAEQSRDNGSLEGL